MLDTTFVVSDAGQYRVSLADLGFPQALAEVQLAVVPEGGAPVVTLAAAGEALFNAVPGNHRLFVIADADRDRGCRRVLRRREWRRPARRLSTDACCRWAA